MRPLTPTERLLVSRLAGDEVLDVDLFAIRATPMQDGGMGSLRFETETVNPVRTRSLGEVQFDDEDGVPVLVELTVDQEGRLFELDVWKTDFSPVRQWPNRERLTAI